MSSADLKANDLALWKAWKADPSPLTVIPLVDAIKPILLPITSKWGKGIAGGRARIPEVVVFGKARNIALDLLKNTYKEEGGAPINFYLNDYVPKKLGEELNKYQNIVRIPKGKSEHVGPIKRAEEDLAARYGRPPDSQEIADMLGLSRDKVEAIREQASQKDYLASQAEQESAVDDDLYQRAKRQTFVELPQQDRAVFDLWINKRKKPDQIMSLLDMSRRQWSSSKTRITDQMQANMVSL